NDSHPPIRAPAALPRAPRRIHADPRAVPADAEPAGELRAARVLPGESGPALRAGAEQGHRPHARPAWHDRRHHGRVHPLQPDHLRGRGGRGHVDRLQGAGPWPSGDPIQGRYERRGDLRRGPHGRSPGAPGRQAGRRLQLRLRPLLPVQRQLDLHAAALLQLAARADPRWREEVSQQRVGAPGLIRRANAEFKGGPSIDGPPSCCCPPLLASARGSARLPQMDMTRERTAGVTAVAENKGFHPVLEEDHPYIFIHSCMQAWPDADYANAHRHCVTAYAVTARRPPAALDQALEEGMFWRLIERKHDNVIVVEKADDIRRAKAENKAAFIMA